MDKDKLLTMPEACQTLRVCTRTAYNLLNAGSLTAVKVGRKTFFRRSEIERYLAELPAYGGRATA